MDYSNLFIHEIISSDIILRDGYQVFVGGWKVEDKNQEALKNYQLNIYSVYRARGAFLVETDQGPKLFKPIHSSQNRVMFEHTIKEHLRKSGYRKVDYFVKTQQDTILSEDTNGGIYTLRDWFVGEECNLKDINQIEEAIKQLATLHKALCEVELTEEQIEHNQSVNLKGLFDKRNRELKRVRAYIRDKNKRNEFELIYINFYEGFYQDGREAIKLLEQLNYDELLLDSILHKRICHGSFNYHNVLMQDLNMEVKRKHDYEETYLEAASVHAPQYEVAITNFDKSYVGVQVYDLYQFIRKAMEKNEWDLLYGSRMLDAYQSIKPLRKEELKLLYILLLYPEKFWKITNYYFNGKKSWVSERNIQKLISVGEQSSKRKVFLEKLKGIL